MKTSTLVILLGGLLSATAMQWRDFWSRHNRTLGQIHQDIKAGKTRVTFYVKIVAPVSIALLILGMYLAVTGR